MEAGLARLARQPGKRDEFLLCLYEKISVVKNSLRGIFELSSRQPG
jgi:hypothetical protein